MKITEFSRQSLSRQFLIASFPIFLLGSLLIGSWVGIKIENGVAHRLGGVTSLYVESFVSHHLQSLRTENSLGEDERVELDSLLAKTALGKKVVSFKVWDTDGKVLYSKNKDLVGKSFPIDEGLADAYSGNVHSEISELLHAEHLTEATRWRRLIETYVPIRADGTDKIIAVAEFYQTTEELDRESTAAQRQSWIIVAAVFLLIYLILFGLVSRGSNTIAHQREDLQSKILLLTKLNEQNEQLNERVRRAAARATALNENFLRRISADLHDGPGQDLGLATMYVKTISEDFAKWSELHRAQFFATNEFVTIKRLLQSALSELRVISAGLRLPDITGLSVNKVVAKAVREYELKSRLKVTLTLPVQEVNASHSVNISLYRILQESLSNGFRHGGGCEQKVLLHCGDGQVKLIVSDSGKGFESGTVWGDKHLGLKGMRERVELLGGSFTINSAPGKGTVIRLSMPLTGLGMEDD
jgi:signal transduction histidine kinase